MAFFNPRRPAYIANPYPALAQQRESEPLHRSTDFEAWVATSYALCAWLLRDRERFAADPALAATALGRAVGSHRRRVPLGEAPTFGSADDALHGRLRAVVNGALPPMEMEASREAIDDMADAIVASLPEDAPFDLMATLADPLPAAAVLTVLGVPAEEQAAFRRITSTIEHVRVNQGASVEAVSAAEAAVAELGSAVASLPDTSILRVIASQLAAAPEAARGAALSVIVQLALVGNGPTAGLIANGTLALIDHPEQLAALRSNPGRLPHAIHELLRFDSPTHTISRVALEDVELGGRRVRKGDLVFAMVGAANRDPEMFVEPDRLDIGRDARNQLAFGLGSHFCLGAPLARMIGEAALAALFSRFESLEVLEVQHGRMFELRVPDRVLLIGR